MEADYERAAVGLRLDRMAVEEVGGAPERLAQAIHDQLGEQPGSVPVRAIAAALDIKEIRSEPLRSMEGALVAPPERGYDAILVNSSSSPRRQRFTIGHELGHFLNAWHVPPDGMSFSCRKEDMRLEEAIGRPSLTRHQRQEIQANAFAICAPGAASAAEGRARQGARPMRIRGCK